MSLVLFNDNYMFLDFHIDFLCVLNEFNLFVICEYLICATQNTG